MYLQITTRCNMTCAHCCYSCTAIGEDMSLETFKKAVDLSFDAVDLSFDYISMGGGEPTIHKDFWKMLRYCMSKNMSKNLMSKNLWLATNGKQAEDALALAYMAKSGCINVALSVDDYHSQIDEKVYKAFCKENPKNNYINPNTGNDYREIRNNNNLINSGRCDFGEDSCPCSEIFVKPNGIIHQCGCINSPIIGNVNIGILIEDPIDGCCYKDIIDEDYYN